MGSFKPELEATKRHHGEYTAYPSAAPCCNASTCVRNDLESCHCRMQRSEIKSPFTLLGSRLATPLLRLPSTCTCWEHSIAGTTAKPSQLSMKGLMTNDGTRRVEFSNFQKHLEIMRSDSDREISRTMKHVSNLPLVLPLMSLLPDSETFNLRAPSRAAASMLRQLGSGRPRTQKQLKFEHWFG